MHVNSLDLRIKGDRVVLDLAEIKRQQTGAQVVSLCAAKSGIRDKTIAADIGVQEAVWSRCKTGQNNLSLDQLDKLMDRCGNEAPLIWLLLKRGYDPASLRKRESETERALREARERIELLEHDKRVLTEALRGTA